MVETLVSYSGSPGGSCLQITSSWHDLRAFMKPMPSRKLAPMKILSLTW